MSSQVETLLVVHRRRRFLLFALILAVVFGVLGTLAWQFGYYPTRHLYLAGAIRFAVSGDIAQQQSVHPVLPPLSFLAFLIVRNPIVLTAVVSGLTIGYLAYFVTTYAGPISVRTLLVIYILLSPSVITLALFDLEWLMLIAVTVGAYGFLLEYCRRDSVYHLFLCGVALAAGYLVVPETSMYVVVFALAVAAVGPPRHRRWVYPLVLLTPILSAAAAWSVVEWYFRGSVHGPLPEFALRLDAPGLVGIIVSSGPFVFVYIALCVAAALYTRRLRSIVIVLLAAPVVLILVSLLWAQPIPAVLHVPLIIAGVIVLYPYFDSVLPSRMLAIILVLLLFAAVGRDTWTVFFRDTDTIRPVSEIVRGGDDRGNLHDYAAIERRVRAWLSANDRGRVRFEGDALLFAHLLSSVDMRRLSYSRTGEDGPDTEIGLIIRRRVDEPVRGFAPLIRSGDYELLRREDG